MKHHQYRSGTSATIIVQVTATIHSRVNAAHVGQKVEADVVNLVEPHVVVHHRGRVVPGTTIDAGNT